MGQGREHAVNGGGWGEERLLRDLLRDDAPSPPAAIDAQRFLDLCHWHGVGPWLSTRLAGRGLPPWLLDAIAPALDAARRRTRADNLLLLGHLERLSDDLDAAGVPFVLLKGMALVPQVYDDPGLRPMTDADLLIRRADWARVRGMALSTGRWRLPTPERERICVRYLYATELDSQGTPACHFEMHWNLELEQRTGFDPEDLMARAVPLPGVGHGWRRLDDLTQALHLALHAAHHFFAPRLVWVLDLRLLAAAGRVPWDELAAAARRAGMSAALAYALDYLERVWPGTVPTGVARRHGPIAARLWAQAATGNPILPTVDLMPVPRRWLYSLAMVDTPARMLRLAAGQAWRKIVLRLPAE